MDSLYRCASRGPLNNGLKTDCDFEQYFESGDYHCPLCGQPLLRIPDGPTVSELLRRGARDASDLSSPPIPQEKGEKQ